MWNVELVFLVFFLNKLFITPTPQAAGPPIAAAAGLEASEDLPASEAWVDPSPTPCRDPAFWQADAVDPDKNTPEDSMTPFS